MRNTKQKEVILNIVNNSYDHLTALEIYEKSRLILPKISLGTVYRNLGILVDNDDIIKLKLDNIDRYDAKRSKHHHFICINCNKILDVNINLDDVVIGKNKVIDYEIKATGICENCLRKEV